MRRLVVFGDSFVDGYATGQPNSIPFVHFLGENLGIKTINKGHRGNSDYVVSYDVFDWFRKNPDLINDSAFLCVFSGWRRGYKVKVDVNDNVEVRGGVKQKYFHIADLASPVIHRHQVETSHWSLVKLFEEHNVPFLFTQSFSDIKQFDYDFLLPPDKYYIEGGKVNNTLLDICKDTWCKKGLLKKLGTINWKANFQRDPYAKLAEHPMLHGCGHPNQDGHIKIAKHLEPYIMDIIK